MRPWNIAFWAALGGVLAAPSILAHPLGNYSINQYFLLDLRGRAPQVYYLLDMAEIPSFAELDLLDTDFDSDITEKEIRSYLERKTPALVAKISMKRDGETVPLMLADRRLSLLEGTAGMVVFNVGLRLVPEQWDWPAEGAPFALEIVSENYPRENGTRECKVLLDGRFTDQSRSLGDAVLGYQTLVFLDDKQNPVYQDFDAGFSLQFGPGSGVVLSPDQQHLSFDWTATARAADRVAETAIIEGMSSGFFAMPGGPQTPEEAGATQTASADLPKSAAQAFSGGQTAGELVERYSQPVKGDEGAAGAMLKRVSDIIRNKELTLPMFMLALAIAAMLGMGHAFSPGHGKTVMAAYLIGERGTVWHAFALGIVVTITHVWSVLLLGVVTLYFRETITEEQLSFWTGIASGAIIVIIGLMLFTRRYAAFAVARAHRAQAHHPAHDHGPAFHHHHEHDHFHDHHPDHHHGHSHIVEGKDGKPPTYGSILWLGVSGGIVPCPAALIVLLLAIKFGRLALGLGLIVAFSIGLAAVLVAIGIVVVRASGEVRRRIGERSPALLALPVVSSVLITVLGLWVVVWTLLQYNVLIIRPV